MVRRHQRCQRGSNRGTKSNDEKASSETVGESDTVSEKNHLSTLLELEVRKGHVVFKTTVFNTFHYHEWFDDFDLPLWNAEASNI